MLSIVQSELEALILEEKYAADLLERKCSIENIDTRQTIEGARVIAERLHVNKAQAKHLYAAGKEVMSCGVSVCNAVQ